MFRRIRAAVASPEKIRGFVALHTTKAYELLRRERLGQAVGYVLEVLTERNPYYDRVVRASNGELVEREIRGSRMYLQPVKGGISRTLLAYGVHEHLSTATFDRELRRLRTATEGDVVVLDIGANIGYFSLLAARTLGERARVYAIEPEPENAALLERNVERNGYADRIEIERCAVGGRDGRANLHRSDQSNRHMVIAGSGSPTTAEEARRADTSLTDSISVPQVTVDRFLEDRAIPPASVGVVRMDLEGYEDQVFGTMKRVLAADGPTLVHVELHPRYLTDDAIESISTSLDDNGFEVVSAVLSEGKYGVYEKQRWHGIPLDVQDFDELRRVLSGTRQYVELVARK